MFTCLNHNVRANMSILFSVGQRFGFMTVASEMTKQIRLIFSYNYILNSAYETRDYLSDRFICLCPYIISSNQ